MKILWYLLTALFGFLGIAGVLSSVELLISGKGIQPATLLLSIVFVVLASACLKKARRC